MAVHVVEPGWHPGRTPEGGHAEHVPSGIALSGGWTAKCEDSCRTDLDYRNFDCLLLLDVVEHMISPERFVDNLRRRLALSPHARVLVSTGNVGYLIVRAMRLLGQFN